MLSEFRLRAQIKEEQSLHPKAALSKDHHRYRGPEEDHRLPYKRDVDRIIHSKAYSRYVDKTQVVYLVENDHITHRSLHVQLVSNFARGIAELLRLNLDLVEAISLGHDVGHPPFGHEGEEYLSELTIEYGNGPFAHSLQSCHLLSDIEPLNLGLYVYDGFLCHDGGMSGNKLMPRFNKTWEDHFNDKKNKKKDPDINIWPATLEGCLVKLCDTVSYLGKDIEDAIQIGIIHRADIPKTVLGQSNKEILSAVAQNLIIHSYDQDFIQISNEIYESLSALRKFNFERIYTHPKLKVESKKIKASYRYMFVSLLEDLERKGKESYIWKNFLENKNKDYLESSSSIQKVIDFISGMTDSYFVRTLERILVPSRIEIS